MTNMTTTTGLEAQWREEAKKLWNEQGRAHWVNIGDFDNYAAGYIRARTEQHETKESETKCLD